MPTFHPSLGTTTVIQLSHDAPEAKYAHLTFEIVFQEGEDTNGQWEIWTDLALVDEHGKRMMDDGAWHGMKFDKVVANETDNAQLMQGESSNVLYLDAEKEEHSAACVTMTARGVIEANEGSNWSYTFRRVMENGEVQWLGWDGGNGFIKVEKSHEGSVADYDQEALAVCLPDASSSSISVHTLPTSEAISAHLVAAARKPRTHSFYRLNESPVSGDALSPHLTYGFVTSSASEGFRLDPGSHFDQIQQFYPSAQTALSSAITDSASTLFAGVHIVQEQPNIAAFHINKTEKGSDSDAGRTWLGIFASSRRSSCTISVEVSKVSEDGHMVAAITKSGNHHVVMEDSTSSNNLNVWIPPGKAVVHLIGIHPFLQLRGTGDAEPIWVCIPGATSIEAGEEEVDSGVPELPAETREVLEEEDHGSEGEQFSFHTESIPELEDEHVREVEPVSNKSSWWILRLVSRFLVNLLHAFLSTLGFGPSSTRRVTPAHGDGADDDETDSGARTPVEPDETTPLIQADMSRSTSITGGLSDGMTTPLKQPLSLLTVIPPTNTGSSARDLVPSPLLTPLEKRVQIRSYIRFYLPTMNHGYHCLLPSGTTFQGKVKVSRRQGDDWLEVPVTEKTREGACTELVLEGVNGETQIEMETVH
ncbi:hypothetical protein BD324DRAFT_607459 [Kockovaella imperatae]|uniref:Uncharacterized protein n=1 Tax=Kockovaella imperatae TaxID=4999 RepID=A0A1Y1ULS8_9TREE|nr:hypothetical protein BD324DRAFT_607459 [Kockovaella imperatae]ORX39010.1 hypothetical protein BD324DRAFT_607459 [Kockovaella imperatae]